MRTDKIKSLTFRVEGMHCPDCAETIRTGVKALPEVVDAKLDHMTAELKIMADAEISPDKILRTIRSLGYSAQPGRDSISSTLFVAGMDCADESRPIEECLAKLPGIEKIGFDLIDNKLFVSHSIPLSDIQSELKSLGFESRPVTADQSDRLAGSQPRKSARIILVLVGLLAIAGSVMSYLQLPAISWYPPLILAIFLGGGHIARKGFHEAIRLQLGINFLMAIAVVGALILGELSEAAMVVFLFTLANYLESRAMTRARHSIRSLMDLAPERATVKTESGETVKSAKAINPGELIIIKPGERIPLDGIVEEGTSRVDQAPITGESMPVKKANGDVVYAGTINEYGSLVVSVTRAYSDSTLSRINKLIEEAQGKKAAAQSFVEKFSRYYTPSVVFLSAMIAIIPPLFFSAAFGEWFYRALILLVISCPCALVISTPVAIVSGLTNAARHGILVKGGAYLEEFGHIDALAMDKTGTITEGRSRLVQILGLNGNSEEELLTLAASVEARSEHPLSRAILNEASRKSLSLLVVQDFQALPGKGLRALVEGQEVVVGNHALFEELNICDSSIHVELEKIENASQTAVLIGNSQSLFGILSIADSIRPEAKPAVEDMRRAGIKNLIMLSGDNHRTASAIAEEIGIDACHAELLPEAKVKAIEELRDRHGRIAMVGDGINDAPALAAANIGISMGSSGTNTALENADIALMKDDLGKLSYLKRLGRYTTANIKQNIAISLGLKAVFLALAIPGLATLWMAVVADMGASLLVVFNGLRVLRFGKLRINSRATKSE